MSAIPVYGPRPPAPPPIATRRYHVEISVLDPAALPIESGAYVADAPLSGAAVRDGRRIAEVSTLRDGDDAAPVIPGEVQSALLRDLVRAGPALDEVGLYSTPEHAAAFRADVAGFRWPKRLPNDFDRSRAALYAYAEIARQWGIPLAVAIAACSAPGYTRGEVEAVLREAYAAGFGPVGERGAELQHTIDNEARLSADRAQRAEKDAIAAARTTPVRAVVFEIEKDRFEPRTLVDGDLVFVWARLGHPDRIVLDARGLPGPLQAISPAYGATLHPAAEVQLTKAEQASMAKLGEFRRTLEMITESRRDAVAAARARGTAAVPLDHHVRAWRAVLANEALQGLRQRGQHADNAGAPSAMALDLGAAVGLDDATMLRLLLEHFPTTPRQTLEELISLRAPVYMPGELVREPHGEEARTLAKESGLLVERVGAYLEGRTLTTFGEVVAALASSGIDIGQDPREAASVREALEALGWRHTQRQIRGVRQRVWIAPEQPEAT